MVLIHLNYAHVLSLFCYDGQTFDENIFPELHDSLIRSAILFTNSLLLIHEILMELRPQKPCSVILLLQIWAYRWSFPKNSLYRILVLSQERLKSPLVL